MGAAVLALVLAACGEPAPSVDKPYIPEADRALGAEHHPQLLAEFGGSYDREEARYVAAIGARIAAAAGLDGQCTFTLVNSNVVNAFAVPGCYIYVTRGLFAIVGSEAELASVLAHEVGHVVASHSRRQERRSFLRTLGVLAVSLTGSERLTRLAGQAAQYFTLRYSRKQEYESDDFGIGYMVDAGYDPFAAGDMLAALERQERFMAASGGRDEARSIPEWARSHPLTQHRIERARATAADLGVADDALPENEAAYLQQVDGLLYGDDPEQGFVVERAFAHPIMRVGFKAPPGFSLTNSPAAILIAGPGEMRGEFGGGAIPAEGLDGYVARLIGHIGGEAAIRTAAPEQTSINGLPVRIAHLRLETDRGDALVSIAAYDGGQGQAYHFVLLSPPANTDTAAINQLFRSFRRLLPAEVAHLRPRVVRTVTVTPGSTLAGLAAQVDDPHPRELFLMLNARTAEQRLTPGERVKIVTYAAGR